MPTIEDADIYMPQWLSAPSRKKLFEDLRRLHAGLSYYTGKEFPHKLQGDAFTSSPYVSFDDGHLSHNNTTVLLLSNTCDISEENNRHLPIMVTVAPIIRIERLRSMLVGNGVASNNVSAKLEAAKRQEISSLFFLPSGSGLGEDSIVLFAYAQSMPLSHFDQAEPQRVAILSQAGHWLLLMKISMHFSRLQDGDVRDVAPSD